VQVVLPAKIQITTIWLALGALIADDAVWLMVSSISLAPYSRVVLASLVPLVVIGA
jgi:hypothetical protein